MITLFTLEVRACLMPAVQDVLSPINVADHVDPPPPYNEINDDPPPRYDELELDVFEIPPPSYEDAVGIQESIV